MKKINKIGLWITLNIWLILWFIDSWFSDCYITVLAATFTFVFVFGIYFVLIRMCLRRE